MTYTVFMSTSTPLNDYSDPVLLPCVLHSEPEGLYEVGKIVGLSIHHCHVESRADVTPGMTISLIVIFPDTQRALLLDDATVTWVRTNEFGLRVNVIRREDAAYLERYLDGITKSIGTC